ncbi:MAG: nucleotidyltransferase substrate binding protein [Sulfuritalea sp.]|nr:nucleotidyltransferase substrate binding protein [Polynucleobacter sp.]MCF8187862.1 nucleotidyltransferase substrate binding protein [Sulfuritalea sp.]
MSDKLNLAPLENAVSRLTEGLARYEKDITDTQIRDGLIQRFEFSYEISHKMLKRHLEAVSPTPEQFDAMAFADLIRSANEQGLLLGDWSAWKIYREMHSKTSHTYDEEIAIEVVHSIPAFLEEARHLLKQLQERNQ